MSVNLGPATSNRPEPPGARQLSAGLVRSCSLALGLALLAAVLWGGYGHHWRWTGINGRTATLWDWLHLLLLPLAVGVLPLWLSRRTRLRRPHKAVGMGVLGVFALLVLIGYTVPWAWTGFVGNRLWDWLELLALPLAVALAPLYRELREVWSTRHTVITGSVLALMLVPVLGGYLGDWAWTGFRGNTLWDWLHLLLLPLLLPTVVVPAITPMATAGIVVPEDAAPGGEGPAPRGTDRAPGGSAHGEPSADPPSPPAHRAASGPPPAVPATSDSPATHGRSPAPGRPAAREH